MYWDVNNLYEWTMSQKLKIDEQFIKRYDKDSDKECIIEVDFKYPKKLHDLHNNSSSFARK